MADFRKEGRPCPIAHRGCMEAGPENSLTAFEEAAALGAGGVEMDGTSAGPGTESWWYSTMQMSGGLPWAGRGRITAER